jgi:hypothetical protein
MSTPARLAAFGLGLLAVFGAAVGVGNAVGPVGPAAPSTSPSSTGPAVHDGGQQHDGEEHAP